jgi:hypothetical protein
VVLEDELTAAISAAYSLIVCTTLEVGRLSTVEGRLIPASIFPAVSSYSY